MATITGINRRFFEAHLKNMQIKEGKSEKKAYGNKKRLGFLVPKNTRWSVSTEEYKVVCSF
jgi:hypothetical protein